MNDGAGELLIVRFSLLFTLQRTCSFLVSYSLTCLMFFLRAIASLTHEQTLSNDVLLLRLIHREKNEALRISPCSVYRRH